jgi:glucose/arabinose dehydrogenase
MDDNQTRRSRDVLHNLEAASLAAAIAVALSALPVASTQRSVEQSVQGPSPQLVKPAERLIPTVNVATAKGWPEGAAPQPAPGLAVNAFAKGLEHPRWVYVLPNGDVLVAETNAPPKPTMARALRGR